MRRVNGGGRGTYVINLIPMFRPEVLITPSGPAIAHSSDFSLVTASTPAAAGELLSLFATGLGPTRPGVDPGQPFPPSPLAAVTSPVEVTVNGRSAEVLAAVGFPGAVDGYQVNLSGSPGYTTRTGYGSGKRGLDCRAGGEYRGPIVKESNSPLVSACNAAIHVAISVTVPLVEPTQSRRSALRERLRSDVSD